MILLKFPLLTNFFSSGSADWLAGENELLGTWDSDHSWESLRASRSEHDTCHHTYPSFSEPSKRMFMLCFIRQCGVMGDGNDRSVVPARQLSEGVEDGGAVRGSSPGDDCETGFWQLKHCLQPCNSTQGTPHWQIRDGRSMRASNSTTSLHCICKSSGGELDSINMRQGCT